MSPPEKPVTLTPEQIEEITRKLADFRHDVNNHLALIVAGIELLRLKPELTDRVVTNMNQQPQKIMDQVRDFSDLIEGSLGIHRNSQDGIAVD